VFIFQSVAITGILALGVTCTLVVGGFDLSIGSVATSSMMLSAYMMVVLEQSAFVAVIACLVMGAFMGLINGLLIVKTKCAGSAGDTRHDVPAGRPATHSHRRPLDRHGHDLPAARPPKASFRRFLYGLAGTGSTSCWKT
jgi:hypothetical protein